MLSVGDLPAESPVFVVKQYTDSDRWEFSAAADSQLVNIRQLFGFVMGVVAGVLHGNRGVAGVAPITIQREAELTRIKEAVESTYDLGRAQIDLLDGIKSIAQELHAAHQRTKRAEESLRHTLGDDIFDKLCPVARVALLGAEHGLLDPEHPDPSQALRGIRVAFENQLQDSFLRPFGEFLEERGCFDYPGERGPQRPKDIIHRGRPVKWANLDDIRTAIGRDDRYVKEYCAAKCFDPVAIRRAIRIIGEECNPDAHSAGSNREFVESVRKRLLVDGGGVFTTIMR
jgi:hypothetical protein